MKAKKIGIGVFLVFSLVAVFSMNAGAADGWYYCTIEKIGANTTSGTCTVLLNETNGAFRKFFTIPAEQYKMTLAIMLTAISNGFAVQVKVDPLIADYHYSYVKDMYLAAQ